MSNHSSILTTVLPILLLFLFTNCDGCKNANIQRKKKPNTSITDEMIARARKGSGHNHLDWEFLAKKLEDLKNGEEGVDINEINENNTPDYAFVALHYAIILGDIDITKALLDMGADPEAQGSYGSTPLHFAASSGHKEIVELLLAKGAKIEKKADDGKPPLHWAAYSGHKEMVELLLAKGADKDAKDKDGRGLLYWAACKGSKEMFKVLLAKGVDKNVQDINGWTACILESITEKEVKPFKETWMGEQGSRRTP